MKTLVDIDHLSLDELKQVLKELFIYLGVEVFKKEPSHPMASTRPEFKVEFSGKIMERT
jgi:hypothetical protein